MVRHPTPYPKEMREKVRHIRNLSRRQMLTSDGNEEWDQGEENLAYEKEVWTPHGTVAVILLGLKYQTHCFQLLVFYYYYYYYISQYFFVRLGTFMNFSLEGFADIYVPVEHFLVYTEWHSAISNIGEHCRRVAKSTAFLTFKCLYLHPWHFFYWLFSQLDNYINCLCLVDFLPTPAEKNSMVWLGKSKFFSHRVF